MLVKFSVSRVSGGNGGYMLGVMAVLARFLFFFVELINDGGSLW